MAPLLLSRRNGIYLCVYPVYTVDATIGKTSKEHAHNSSPLLCLGREQKLLRPLWRRSCCCWLVQLKQPDRRQLAINRGQSHSSFFLVQVLYRDTLLCTSNFDCALDFDFGFSSSLRWWSILINRWVPFYFPLPKSLIDDWWRPPLENVSGAKTFF